MPSTPNALTFRSFSPGDIGWIVHRHGLIYHQEFGWDETFEAHVAVVLGEFVKNFDAARERCWIAELDGRFAGCVFLVHETDTVARLRCLLVEPFARGAGVGAALVRECLRFARECGYEQMTLWTNSVLEGARRIYTRCGFTLTLEERCHIFGHNLVAETWDIDLRPGPPHKG